MKECFVMLTSLLSCDSKTRGKHLVLDPYEENMRIV